MKIHIIKHISFGLVMIGALCAIVMFLWNLLIPSIFGLTAINFWQALGLFILARLLLGGMGGRFMLGRGMHSHHNPVREKWMKMTDEERKEFIRRRHPHGHRVDFFHTEEPEKES
jgi:hypothetical protein